jgi:16S rRNA (uracil1498-N3)-methyltransferase
VRNRFFVDAELIAGEVVSLGGDERHHARVLRVSEGEEVEVFNGRGVSFAAKFESADGIRLVAPTANRELRTAISLAMAIIQPDKFELVLQKATELGAASIIPLVTDRSEVRVERVKGKQERWHKIVFEAVKQSGRARIPKIGEPVSFAEAIARGGVRIVFDADEPATAPEPLRSDATLFVGPEGGWSEEEVRLARERGCAFRRLGERRLRAETAAIVAVAVVSLSAVW